ncbi:sensor histidine kinase [Paenibacillus sp. CAU 1782]
MIKWLGKKLFLLLPKTKIVRKLFIGYVLIILIPFLIFVYLLYSQAHIRFLEEYMRNRQDVIEQANSNLKLDLTQAESVYQLFQNDQYAIEYLSGAYETESQHVYSLIKYIRPRFSYVYNGNPQIVALRMYSTHPGVYALGPEFREISELMDSEQIYAKVKQLTPGKGIWLYHQSERNKVPILRFYQNLYNESYSKQIGILEVQITDKVFGRLIDKVKTKPSDTVIVLSRDNELIYSDIEDTDKLHEIREASADLLSDSNPKYAYLRNVDLMGNSINVEPLFMKIVSLADGKEVNTQRELEWFAWGGIISLLVLSMVYYWIATSLTRRILKLAKHMRNVDSDNFSKYEDNSRDQDEIAFLALSYNAMLQRIDDLVNTVHRAELMRKESDYKVLQAQIKPHFLYNTLESIRMLAEVKEAPEVADFTHTFGKLIRYSLSNDQTETTLHDEVDHVRNFLVIHKNRVGERLQFEIRMDAQIKKFICPRFILQPLVENSIVHGLSKLRRQWVLQIQVLETEQYIEVYIIDNGIGIEEKRLTMIQGMLKEKEGLNPFHTASSGLGVYNVHERIKQFYGHDSGLTLASRHQEGTTCVVRMYKGEEKDVEFVSGR